MICFSLWCEKCNSYKTIVTDVKTYNTLYNNTTFICDECTQKQVIEKRDKKLNQLLKRNWFDIFKR